MEATDAGSRIATSGDRQAVSSASTDTRRATTEVTRATGRAPKPRRATIGELELELETPGDRRATFEYSDFDNSDVFILSQAEDLVPTLIKQRWQLDAQFTDRHFGRSKRYGLSLHPSRVSSDGRTKQQRTSFGSRQRRTT